MGYETDLKLFIDGAWKSGEDRDHFHVVNPVDGQPIAELPLATEADLDEALAGADRLHVGAGPGPVDHFARWRG